MKHARELCVLVEPSVPTHACMLVLGCAYVSLWIVHLTRQVLGWPTHGEIFCMRSNADVWPPPLPFPPHAMPPSPSSSGIEEAPKAASVAERGEVLNAYFTYSLYVNICRSLFERHKLMFSLLLAIKILQSQGEPGRGVVHAGRHKRGGGGWVGTAAADQVTGRKEAAALHKDGQSGHRNAANGPAWSICDPPTTITHARTRTHAHKMWHVFWPCALPHAQARSTPRSGASCWPAPPATPS